MDASLFQREAYLFDLPEHLIAQAPTKVRHESRLMLVDRQKEQISSLDFSDLEGILQKGDALVFNNTKVIPAKLFAKRPTGGQVEFLLLEPLSQPLQWEAMAKPVRKLREGMLLRFSEKLVANVLTIKEAGHCEIAFECDGDFDTELQAIGQMPLPPYIKRDGENPFDTERYQTVYAKHKGAVAAPTAGLHFSKEILASLESKGVLFNYLTLHVGAGTFKPVQVDDIRSHPMHRERFFVDHNEAKALSTPVPGRRIAVGTTSCRVLESCVQEGKIIPEGAGETDIFIYPGFSFRYVDHLLTNFHLPGSTLLMLISAFGGYELIKEAYAKAVKEEYRFFSYGDAMLIL